MACGLTALIVVGALAAGAAAPRDDVVFRSASRARGTSLMPNGGFEDGTTGCAAWREGFERIEGPAAHSGKACVRLTSRDPKLQYGVLQHVRLDQEKPRLVMVEAWSRAEKVSGGVDSGYSLYVDVTYRDGSHLWQQTAAFPVGTHGWVRRAVSILAEKPIAELLVYGLLRGHTGTVWFDDFAAYVPKEGGLFDGIPIGGRAAGRVPGAGRVAELRTGDGLCVSLDAAGRIVSLKGEGEAVDPGLIGASGFFVRDVAAGSDFVRPTTRVERNGDLIELTAVSRELQLEVRAQLNSVYNRIQIFGTIGDTSGKDRCVSVYFGVPLKLDGAVWWDDAERKRAVTPHAQYGNWSPVGVGANGFLSRYPWSAVTTPNDGVSMWVPMEMPQLVRMGIAAGLTYVVFDVGLTPKTTNNPGRASFAFGLYRHDLRWGFRDAMRRYYLPPYTPPKRVESEGIWLITKSVKAIRNPEDFHLKFHETGPRKEPACEKLGILSFRYSEPWRWRQRYSRERGAGTAEQRSREGTMAFLEKALASENAHIRRHSWAVKGAVCHDECGQPVFYIEDAPWGTSALFVCSADPNLPTVGPDKVNQARCFYSPAIARQRYESGIEPEQDGEYIDSVEGFRWPRVRNYREGHFAYAEYPLVFGTHDRRVCILNAFSHCWFLRYVAHDLWRRDKLMFGNYLPNDIYFFMPYFDVIGTEHHWINRKGEWRPEAASRTDYRRALSHRKPYLMLLNTDFTKMSYAAVEKYMRRCAFWAMFPSMFSHDAFHDRYFDSPKYYDRDRPLFRKYVPIILAMAKAGWCPIPHARCADPAIRFERFGHRGTVFVSVLNTDTEKARTARITLDPEPMGLRGTPEATELFSGRTLAVMGSVVSLDVAADDVAVLQLTGR